MLFSHTMHNINICICIEMLVILLYFNLWFYETLTCMHVCNIRLKSNL